MNIFKKKTMFNFIFVTTRQRGKGKGRREVDS